MYDPLIKKLFKYCQKLGTRAIFLTNCCR